MATVSFEAYAFTANVAGVSVSVEPETLPLKSLAFVLEYGLRQYIQDGAAVAKTVKDGETTRDKTPEEIAQEKREGVEERVANLLAGEFTRRTSAPKQTPEERERNAVVLDGLQKFAKGLGKPLPSRTGKKANPELLDKMIAAWYTKNKVEIDKEVARRLRANEKIDLGDMTELAGMLG